MENGDFLRTKSGNIGKIIDARTRLLKINDDCIIAVPEEDVLVYNKNLFYVVFPNDYVNGKKIRAKISDEIGSYFLIGYKGIITPDKVTSVMSAEKYKEIEEFKQVLKDLENKSNCIIN